MAKVLDRSKDFGEIYGPGVGRFMQGDVIFGADGNEIVAPKEGKAQEKARLAEEARLLKEEEARLLKEEEERLLEEELLAEAAARNAAAPLETTKVDDNGQGSLLDAQLAAQQGVLG